MNLIISILGEGELPEIPREYSEDFNKFWKEFPATDGFGSFPSTRNIRTGKKEAYQQWLQLVSQGYTPQSIIFGLKTDIEQRKNSSTIRGGNNLKFIKSPVNYLKSKCFLDFEEEEPQTTFYADGSFS